MYNVITTTYLVRLVLNENRDVMFLLALAEKVHFYIIPEGYKSIQFAVMRNKVCYLL